MKTWTAPTVRWSRASCTAGALRVHVFSDPLLFKGVTQRIAWDGGVAGKPQKPGSTSRNAVFYGDKAIDRSPCGTGTSARMAQWFARGKLKVGDSFIHESIIGSIFNGRVV